MAGRLNILSQMRETRLYAYGVLPRTNLHLVEEQVALAHRYRNTLVELELERRARFREITGEDEQVSAIAAAIENGTQRLGALRLPAATQTKSKKELRQEAAHIRAELREMRARHKAQRQAATSDPAVQERLVELRAHINEKWRQARSESRLYWGTYLIVERAIDRARMGKMDPRPRRWNGRGSIGVRLTNSAGLTYDALVAGESGAFRLEPVPPDAWCTRSSRRRVRPLMHFRVGTEDRAPIWAEFVVCMHRPLPPGATVKWARILRERVGPDTRYSLLLTVSIPQQAPKRHARPKHIAALHGAWRQMPNGDLRAGYLVDDQGGAEDLRLPASMVSAFEHADSLRAIRDANREQFCRQLVDSLSTLPALPEWMQEELTELERTWHYEEFARRLRALLQGPVDAALQVRAEVWRRQERHLWQWEAHARARTRRCRHEMYRKWAAEWGRKYGVLRLEDYDLRILSRGEAVGGELAAAVQRNRRIVALHELRAAAASALTVEYVSPYLLAQTCHVCGVVGEYDVRRSLAHTCSACGKEWDAHLNAARNMLRWAPVKREGGALAAPPSSA